MTRVFVVSVSLVAMLCLVGSAQQYVESVPNQGVQLRVWFASPSEPPSLYSHEPLRYGFGVVDLADQKDIKLLRDEYLCRLTLTDESGNQVQKSRAGAGFGSRLSEVPPKGDPSPYFATGQSTLRRAEASGAPIFELPAVEQLFNIPRGGRYELTLEMQAAQRKLGPSKVWRLIRFQPVKIPIICLDSRVRPSERSPAVGIVLGAIAIAAFSVVWILFRKMRARGT